ncbi:bile acid:sodium symporter, partial [Bombella apis]
MKRLDPFLMCLIGAVLLASFLPCPVVWQPWLSRLTSLLIMLMFFFQGAKLKRRALLDSVKNWRLQGCTLLITFAVFPLLGAGMYWLAYRLSSTGFLGPDLWAGMLFLCCLPSTIQSSIALTSMARGNVPAAICAATVSNILGILITPL